MSGILYSFSETRVIRFWSQWFDSAFFLIELMTRRFDYKTMKKVLCLILKPFDTLRDFGKEILD